MVESAHSQTVLLVDDESDILRALGDYLQASVPGTRIVSASGGPEALALLDGGETQVDLILSDFKMPGMDGLEFLARARAKLPGVARVLMTAYPDMELAIRALNEEHIQYFFAKPVEPEEVREVVRGLLQEQRSRRQREQALQRTIELMRRGRGAAPSA